MTPAWLRCGLAPLFLATLCAAPASAQGLEGQVGRFYDDEGWDIYRLGISRALTGPLGLGLQANYLQRAQGGDGALAGLSLDLTAFKGAGQGPYLVAGVGAGMGSSASDDFSDAWGSWSVGGGYQLLPASFLSFAAEARWRELSLDARDGLEMAAGLSIRFGGRGGGSPQPATTPVAELPPPTEAPPSDPPHPAEGRDADRLRQAVVATAKDAMGRPYAWGGTGENGGGFDCSGLIQHAYGWIPAQAMEELATFLGITPAEVLDTASFYEEYWLKPKGKHLISVCRSIACEFCGQPGVTDAIKAKLGIEVGETTDDGKFTLIELECLGACGGGPALLIDETLHENVKPDQVAKLIDAAGSRAHAHH